MNQKKILFIEVCNFVDYPIGGYLAFAKQMITAFGSELYLVGMSTDDTPIGKWIKKDINGITYNFFSVKKCQPTNVKTIIPGRLKSYWAVTRFKKKILEKNINNIFIQTPEVLFALRNESFKNLCVRIPGVENPLAISRYWYGKYFAKIFDYYFFKYLKKSNIILASADNQAIIDFINRGKNAIINKKVIQFPTRVDDKIFHPISKVIARNKLALPETKKIIVTTGRLSELKGGKFMLTSFMHFRKTCCDSHFIFIGDGEDRNKIHQFVIEKNLSENVSITGRLSHEKVSLFINAADIFMMGSYIEGWATSLAEAVACGKPVVCTNFSSANELIKENENGYILNERDEEHCSALMLKCLNIPEEKLLKKSVEMSKYSTANLKESILEYWKLT